MTCLDQESPPIVYDESFTGTATMPNEPSLQRLQQEQRFHRRALVVLAAGYLVTLFAAFTRERPPALPSIASDSTLVLRTLSIVDERGVERLRLGAPLPDPIMLGRRFSRGEKVYGVLLYDSEGNERGGYVTDEERHAALTLDEINRAAIHLGVGDRGEAHLSLSNGSSGYALLGMRPGGTFLTLDGKSVMTRDSAAASAR
jgi:hypothetical protein